MKELTVDATFANIETVTEFVNAKLEAVDCPPRALMQIDVALDELVSNVARYAYEPDVGSVTVRVETEQDPPAVHITLIDRGRPFNPLAAEDPDVSASLENRRIGGLGIFLVKKTMDALHYERREDRNLLRITKLLTRKAETP